MTEAEFAAYQRQHGLVPAVGISEKAFQSAVIRVAKQHGWSVFHPYAMKRSQEGYPDLTLAHPDHHVAVWAELKVPGGVVTLQQQHWLTTLSQVTHVEAHLWTPDDMPAIMARLQLTPPAGPMPEP